MPDLTDTEIDAALARGHAARATEPHAASAAYDVAQDRITVTLTNGCVFAFPPCLAQGLQSATPDELAEVEILGAGTGLHWERLDTDLSVPALLAGLFGTRAFMARQAGQITSPPNPAPPAPTVPKVAAPARPPDVARIASTNLSHNPGSRQSASSPGAHPACFRLKPRTSTIPRRNAPHPPRSQTHAPQWTLTRPQWQKPKRQPRSP